MKQRAFYLFVFVLLALEAGAQAATTTYAATTKGPYKTTDGGATWQPVKVTVASALLQGVPDVAAIAVDPLNSANIYFIGRSCRNASGGCPRNTACRFAISD